MRTGYNGRVAISWTQTEIDGLEAAPLAFLAVGSAWSWRGQALMLSDTAGMSVERTEYAGGFGTRSTVSLAPTQELSGNANGTVVLTNGAQQFTAYLVAVEDEVLPTLVFENGCPPRDQEFWISEFTEAETQIGTETERDNTVIAFPSRRQALTLWPVDGRRVAANSPRSID